MIVVIVTCWLAGWLASGLSIHTGRIGCAQVVRKVDELPLPPETIRYIAKRTNGKTQFTTDTQAMVDTAVFAEAIGDGLPDKPRGGEEAHISAVAQCDSEACSCGPVCWPQCPRNEVAGDPVAFLRRRQNVKQAWAVAKMQAHWRGFKARKELATQNHAATQEGLKEAQRRAQQGESTQPEAQSGDSKVEASFRSGDALANLQVRDSATTATFRKRGPCAASQRCIDACLD